MKILDYEDRDSVNEMLSQFDTDHDKKLSKEEFIKLMKDENIIKNEDDANEDNKDGSVVLRLNYDSTNTLTFCSGWIADGLSVNGTVAGGSGQGDPIELNHGEKITIIEGSRVS